RDAILQAHVARSEAESLDQRGLDAVHGDVVDHVARPAFNLERMEHRLDVPDRDKGFSRFP
ncbi:MAG TPA: hypothetical protein VFQ76_00665, partial [Longimicrobiaceae bacterium]|nr:hypothetical protein [Longimicrobiaceae bacterium]